MSSAKLSSTMMRYCRGVLACGLLVFVGCAGGKADATGKVTHRGKALAFGTVVMRGPDGIDIPGTIDPDGSYRVLGVTSGPVKIGVISRDPGPPAASKGRASSREADVATKADRNKWFALPEKYEDPAKSGLETTLKSGPNRYDIELP